MPEPNTASGNAFQRIVETRFFQNTVIALILASSLLIGLETYPYLRENHSNTLNLLENIILASFVIELLIRIAAFGKQPWRFFMDAWNIFDFVIVAVCFLPDAQFGAILRLARILRIFRVVSLAQKAEIERLRNVELAEAYRALEAEKAESERLLLNVLPQLIAKRLKEGEDAIADSFDDVTVIFADIVGFTPLSTRNSPEKVVSILDGIFSRFDTLVEKYDLEKIKTIGDAYMVVSGVPKKREDHTEVAALMSLEMMQAIEDFNQENNENLSIRIGFHSGPVVAGIIGKKKFVYDLWGDTVNIASRLESHGKPGSIQVAESTWTRLRDKFSFEARGCIEVKGKGELDAYFLTGCKDNPKTTDSAFQETDT